MTLSEWLAGTKTQQRELAEMLGVNQTAVSQWVTGKTTPTPENIAKIEQATRRKVRFADWVAQKAA